MKRRLPALLATVFAALLVAVSLSQTQAYASGTMTIVGQVTDGSGPIFGHEVVFFALDDSGNPISSSRRSAGQVLFFL